MPAPQQIRFADPKDAAVENLRAMVTAQSALIFGLLTVLGDSRIVPRGEIRTIFQTALEMIDSIGSGMPGVAPSGLKSARLWLEQLLDGMPPTWSS